MQYRRKLLTALLLISITLSLTCMPPRSRGSSYSARDAAGAAGRLRREQRGHDKREL
jgi:hypothetical protein